VELREWGTGNSTVDAAPTRPEAGGLAALDAAVCGSATAWHAARDAEVCGSGARRTAREGWRRLCVNA
jgi:hypothetical protein